MSGFVRVASVDEIPSGSIKKVRVGVDVIAVANTSEGIFAMIDECSHAQVPLSNGTLHGHELQCKAHGARFDLRTGAVTAPPALAPIEMLEVEIRGNDIFVRLDQ